MLKYLTNAQGGAMYVREVVPVHPLWKFMNIIRSESDGSRNKPQCSNMSRVIIWNISGACD